MVLNATEIQNTIVKLNEVLAEQERILKDAEQVILNDLSGAWECQAQRAYAEAFVDIKNSILTQINDLIRLFGSAFEQSQNGLYEVDVDISAQNATVLTGE